MKVLIPVSSKKKLGIITAVKWTIQKFTTSRKHKPNIMENQINIISTQLIANFEE
jgi:hypothetical protein